MKKWLDKNNDKKLRITAALIAIGLIIVSLMTSGLISAICDLIAFVILITVVWLKVDESKHHAVQTVSRSDRVEIEP